MVNSHFLLLLLLPLFAHSLIVFEYYTSSSCTVKQGGLSWGPNGNQTSPYFVPLKGVCNFCGNNGGGVSYTQVDATLGVTRCGFIGTPPSTGSPCNLPGDTCETIQLGVCTNRGCGVGGAAWGKYIEIDDKLGVTIVALGYNQEERTTTDLCVGDNYKKVALFARFFLLNPTTIPCSTSTDCVSLPQYTINNLGAGVYCQPSFSSTCATVAKTCVNAGTCYDMGPINQCCDKFYKPGTSSPVIPQSDLGVVIPQLSFYITDKITSNDMSSTGGGGSTIRMTGVFVLVTIVLFVAWSVL